jgi:hypothetical protein
MLQDLWKERQGLMAAIAELEAGDNRGFDRSDEMDNLVCRLYDGPERTISQTVPGNLDECLILARLLSTKYCGDFDNSNWQGAQDVHLTKSLLAGLERLADDKEPPKE